MSKDNYDKVSWFFKLLRENKLLFASLLALIGSWGGYYYEKMYLVDDPKPVVKVEPEVLEPEPVKETVEEIKPNITNIYKTINYTVSCDELKKLIKESDSKTIESHIESRLH